MKLLKEKLMSRLLSSLTLLLLLVVAAQPALGVVRVVEKNRAPEFFAEGATRVWEMPSSSQDGTRGNEAWSYEFASDVCEGPNLYAYVGNGPTGAVDPLGLEVDITFNITLGKITVTDRQTGATETADAFSGNVHANDPAYANAAGKDTGPLPAGDYEILNHPTGLVHGKTWYDLDRADGTRDDYDPVSKRGKFRLHAGTASDGCVTVTDDRSPLDYHGGPNGNLVPGSPNAKKWDNIMDIIKKTSTSTVKDTQGRSRIFYGNAKVTP